MIASALLVLLVLIRCPFTLGLFFMLDSPGASLVALSGGVCASAQHAFVDVQGDSM